jgi:hypothetical protein
MKPEVAFWAVFFAVVVGFSAGTETYVQAKPHLKPTSPRKFDEFGAVGHCDLGARLDNFAIQLTNEPDVIGHVVVYGAEGEGVGSGRQRLKLIKDYLTEARGLPGPRIKTVYAGRNEDLIQPKIQLWITQAGVRLPEMPKFETNIDSFKGRFNQDETEDYVDLLWPEEMGQGIGVAGDAAFADMLQQQKKAIAYVVAYNGERVAPGKIRPDRFIVLFTTSTSSLSGNYLDLWAMPPGQPLPDPNSEEEDEDNPEKTEKDPPVSDVVQNAQRRP